MKTKPIVPSTPKSAEATTEPKRVESLDTLVQVLQADDLRHVIGGGRVKYPHFA